MSEEDLQAANDELNVVDIYGRNTLNANDLADNEERVVVIKRVGATWVDPWPEDEDQSQKQRAEFWFEGEPKSFIPGKEVIYMIAATYGFELTRWVGRKVVLYRGTWRNGGRSGVRIEWRPHVENKPKTRRKTQPKRRPKR